MVSFTHRELGEIRNNTISNSTLHMFSPSIGSPKERREPFNVKLNGLNPINVFHYAYLPMPSCHMSHLFIVQLKHQDKKLNISLSLRFCLSAGCCGPLCCCWAIASRLSDRVRRCVRKGLCCSLGGSCGCNSLSCSLAGSRRCNGLRGSLAWSGRCNSLRCSLTGLSNSDCRAWSSLCFGDGGSWAVLGHGLSCCRSRAVLRRSDSDLKVKIEESAS